MKLIGLAGAARSGKDTVADHLVAAHNFMKFSFTDGLYPEVSRAWNVPVAFLQDARLKDVAHFELAVGQCADTEFIECWRDRELGGSLFSPVSPRRILQWWGTEYRRSQDPDYWVNKTRDVLYGTKFARQFSQSGWPLGMVNSSVRFANEMKFLREEGAEIWCIARPNLPHGDNRTHVSEIPLVLTSKDRLILNGGSISSLQVGVSRFLISSCPRLEIGGELVE